MTEHARRRNVQIATRPDGRRVIGFSGAIQSLKAELAVDFEELREPGILSSEVTPPRRKVAAARWFLIKFRECIDNELAALTFLESFLSELRASTFALQNLLRKSPGFDAWYEQQVELMRNDERLAWLKIARNSAVKEGLVLHGWEYVTVLRFHRNGEVTAESAMPEIAIEGIPGTIRPPDFDHMIERVSSVVEQAHDRFFKSSSRQNAIAVHTIRERDDGTWEHFNLNSPPTLRLTPVEKTSPR